VVLEWLWQGSFSGKHQALQAKRAKGTGEWLFENHVFKKWVSDSTSRLLICSGIRNHLLVVADESGCREVDANVAVFFIND